jgi:hypothetical protein
MTTLIEAKEAIYTRFLASFTGTSNIVFDNEDPSFDLDVVPDWCRLSIRHVDRNQETLGKVGNRRFRVKAIAFVQVYTKSNTGVQQSGVLVTEARDVFEGSSFSGLDFNNAKTPEGGPEGKWYTAVVEANFDYDEIK